MVMGPVTLLADRETKEHNNGYVVTRASLETRDQAAQTDIPYDALGAKRAEQVVQALSITVQYLAYEVSSPFSRPLNIISCCLIVFRVALLSWTHLRHQS